MSQPPLHDVCVAQILRNEILNKLCLILRDQVTKKAINQRKGDDESTLLSLRQSGNGGRIT